VIKGNLKEIQERFGKGVQTRIREEFQNRFGKISKGSFEMKLKRGFREI
jgi:hypothetical protein